MEPSLPYPDPYMHHQMGYAPSGPPPRAPPQSYQMYASNRCIACDGEYTHAVPCVVLCVDGHCACRMCALSMRQCPMCRKMILRPGGVLLDDIYGEMGGEEELSSGIGPLDEDLLYSQYLENEQQRHFPPVGFAHPIKRPRMDAVPIQQYPVVDPALNIMPSAMYHNSFAVPPISNAPINHYGNMMPMGQMPMPAQHVVPWPQPRRKVPKPKPQQQEIMPRCQAGHKLQIRKTFTDKSCAICNDKSKNTPARRCFYCRKCDFVMCIECTPAVYKGSNTTEDLRRKTTIVETDVESDSIDQHSPSISAITAATTVLAPPGDLELRPPGAVGPHSADAS